jgi:hypothetical protein
MLRGAMKPALVLLRLKVSAACANLSAIDTSDFMWQEYSPPRDEGRQGSIV